MPTIYQRLLALYPETHRQQFGEEMMAVFEEVRADIRDKGASARAKFCVREIAGLLNGAIGEHMRAFIGSDPGFSFSTRRFTMRNGFRFPKSTAVLMTIILLGVILAIRKGEAIAYSLPHVNPQIPPIQPVHSVLLSGIPLMFMFFYAAGLVGWAILFALRRSGVHRLADVSGERK
jgi:hypothetical protein